MPSGASGILLKGMKNIYSLRKLSNVDDAPLAENMDADFIGAAGPTSAMGLQSEGVAPSWTIRYHSSLILCFGTALRGISAIDQR